MGRTVIVDTLPAKFPEGWTMRMSKDSPHAEIHSDEGWFCVYEDGEKM